MPDFHQKPSKLISRDEESDLARDLKSEVAHTQMVALGRLMRLVEEMEIPEWRDLRIRKFKKEVEAMAEFAGGFIVAAELRTNDRCCSYSKALTPKIRSLKSWYENPLQPPEDCETCNCSLMSVLKTDGQPTPQLSAAEKARLAGVFGQITSWLKR